MSLPGQDGQSAASGQGEPGPAAHRQVPHHVGIQIRQQRVTQRRRPAHGREPQLCPAAARPLGQPPRQLGVVKRRRHRAAVHHVPLLERLCRVEDRILQHSLHAAQRQHSKVGAAHVGAEGVQLEAVGRKGVRHRGGGRFWSGGGSGALHPTALKTTLLQWGVRLTCPSSWAWAQLASGMSGLAACPRPPRRGSQGRSSRGVPLKVL